MVTDYQAFLATKEHKAVDSGKVIDINNIHSKLFEWQRKVTQWAIRKGRCAIWLDTGLGKTFCQLQWAKL